MKHILTLALLISSLTLSSVFACDSEKKPSKKDGDSEKHMKHKNHKKVGDSNQ